MNSALLLLVLVLAMALLLVWLRWRRLARAQYIRTYAFPPGLYERLEKKRPGLALKDRQLVGRALRQYFLAHLNSGRQFVSMPSQVTDDLWHEFILYTRHYKHFCNQAFGKFFHHTPAVVLGANRQDNLGLRRTWWQCCREENINPRTPSRLPLLFAIDAKLGIADGFRYAPDCSSLRQGGDGAVYCGGDFASSGSGCSGDSGGGLDSSSGDSGGDGGSSCGGGCGGGD